MGPQETSNPVVQGPLGPVMNPMTGKPFRADTIKAQPSKRTQSPELPADTISSNARTADAMLKASDFSGIKPHVMEAWNNGGETGRAEVLNLAQQMEHRSPGAGQTFANDMGLGVQVADNSQDTFRHLKTREADKATGTPNPDDALFKHYRKKLAPREGGLADRPKNADPGGLTNKGMSQTELNNLRNLERWKHLPESAKDLTDEKIDRIYRKEYFDRPQIDKLAKVKGLEKEAPKLAEHVFDSGVLHGIEDSGRWLQESLDETLGTELRTFDDDGAKYHDGIIGSETRATVERAVRDGKIKEVNNLFVKKRIEYMKARSNFKSNAGWIPRAESFLMK